MLLKKAELETIKSGDVTLVFRRWQKPTVKTGGTLKTAVGLLGIDRVTKIDRSQITKRDAVKAGYDSLPLLLDQLAARSGDIYRIEVRFAGADPRVKLRASDQLEQAELLGIQTKLARLDAAGQVGPWTRQVLKAVDQYPQVAAAELAAKTGFEKEWLKRNIRKLKNLGLTISHQPGYEISPRGKVVLMYLKAQTIPSEPAAKSTKTIA